MSEHLHEPSLQAGEASSSVAMAGTLVHYSDTYPELSRSSITDTVVHHNTPKSRKVDALIFLHKQRAVWTSQPPVPGHLRPGKEVLDFKYRST